MALVKLLNLTKLFFFLEDELEVTWKYVSNFNHYLVESHVNHINVEGKRFNSNVFSLDVLTVAFQRKPSVPEYQ